MGEYNLLLEASTDDPCNAILLCSNFHGLFDVRKFALVPKTGCLGVHALEGWPSEKLSTLYHDV